MCRLHATSRITTVNAHGAFHASRVPQVSLLLRDLGVAASVMGIAFFFVVSAHASWIWSSPRSRNSSETWGTRPHWARPVRLFAGIQLKPSLKVSSFAGLP